MANPSWDKDLVCRYLEGEHITEEEWSSLTPLRVLMADRFERNAGEMLTSMSHGIVRLDRLRASAIAHKYYCVALAAGFCLYLAGSLSMWFLVPEIALLIYGGIGIRREFSAKYWEDSAETNVKFTHRSYEESYKKNESS